LPVARDFFYISLEFLNKCSSDKKNLTLFSKALGKERPPNSPERDLYGNRPPFPYFYLAYPSGSSVKEPSLQVSLIELSQREIDRERERERHSFSRALLPSFKVPGK
jgi:hypothetical protein